VPDGPAQGEVEILLATCNTGRWLDEQIDSILGQSHKDLRILVHDDRSEDRTPERLEQCARVHPGKVRILPGLARRLGPVGSFSRLLDESSGRYVMFCDHDDVWAVEKVAATLERMRRGEQTCPAGTPMMVFTDLEIVDESLRTLCDSYWRFQRIDPARLELRQLVTQNVPSGCTMMLNRPLADLCTPISDQAVMHDHWVTLAAAAMGRILYLDRRTVRYRQHASNVFGASGGRLHQLALRTRGNIGTMRERFYRNVVQGRAFVQRYRDRLSRPQIALLEAFGSLDEQGPLTRRHTLLKHRIYKSGLARNLMTLLLV
jgi:glycosyltransferase involved in cell wall biosynthesis